MKLAKVEKYILELDKEDLLFLFEIIDKIKLDGTSSPKAFEIMQKFKAFREQEIDQQTPSFEPTAETHDCDGCMTKVSSMKTCPVAKVEMPLCEACYIKRLEYAKAAN